MSQNKLSVRIFLCEDVHPVMDCQVLWNTSNRIQWRKIPKSLGSCGSHKSLGIYWKSLKVRKIGNALARPRFTKFRGITRLSGLARFSAILRYLIEPYSEVIFDGLKKYEWFVVFVETHSRWAAIDLEYACNLSFVNIVTAIYEHCPFTALQYWTNRKEFKAAGSRDFVRDVISTFRKIWTAFRLPFPPSCCSMTRTISCNITEQTKNLRFYNSILILIVSNKFSIELV